MAVSIYELFTKRKAPDLLSHPVVPMIGDGGTRYARAALEHEAAAVAGAPMGTRNATLNRAAFSLSQLIAAQHLPPQVVWDTLTAAARTAGLDDVEIDTTLKSGYHGGTTKTRTNVPDPTGDADNSWLPPVTLISAPPPADPPAATTPPVDVQAVEAPANDLDTLVRRNLPLINWQALWDDDEEEEWILEPLLPARRLVALYSPPKVGKSLLMLEIAVAISRGAPTLGTSIDRPHRVLYVDFENDPKGDIRSRLQAMGHTPSHLDNLCYLSFPTLAGLDSERGSEELMAAVQVYDCDVVIIDTVSRSVQGEENENDTWLNFYRHTGLKMKQQGVAMIRLDHTGKDESKGQRGGSAKVGDVDAVWKLSKVADDVFQLDCEANRMPVTEQCIVLTRTALPHLHHHVQAAGRAAAWEAKIRDVTRALDAAGAPRDMGRTKARELLKTTGVSASNAVLDEALRQRKNVPYVLPDAGGDRP
ncbi:MAG TPA: AAA family ATPase [Rariglobus sp.]